MRKFKGRFKQAKAGFSELDNSTIEVLSLRKRNRKYCLKKKKVKSLKDILTPKPNKHTTRKLQINIPNEH